MDERRFNDTAQPFQIYENKVKNKYSYVSEVQLPYDFANKETYTKGVNCFSFNFESSRRIWEICKGNETAVFVYLLAAFQCFLARYTSANQITIVSPVFSASTDSNSDNRFLLLRNEINGGESFKDFLFQVKGTLASALKNQHPLAMSTLNDDNNSLFRIIVAYEGVHSMFSGTDVIATEVNDISVVFSHEESRFVCSLFYNAELFLEKSIDLLADCFLFAVEQVLQNSLIKIDSIGLISSNMAAELERLNRTGTHYSESKTLHQLFEEASEQLPECIAIKQGWKTVCYRELNQKSNQLARTLVERGAGPNTVVAILLERSVEMIISVLAALKTGAAYLPISINNPTRRTCEILNDCRPDILIMSGEIPVFNGYAGQLIDIYTENIYHENMENLHKSCSSNDLAYIIYTSGTTGKQKGVLISHESICNTIMWRKEEYKLSSADTTMQLFDPSFDGFLTSFFTPAVSGAKIVLLSEKEAKDPSEIIRIIAQESVSHLICVPSLFSIIIDYAKESDLESIKILTLAGEKLSDSLVSRIKRMCPFIEIVNEYGPTENSVVTTFQRNVEKNDKITVGKPIANTSVYILDKNNSVCPVGAVGELCVAGKGLSKGYLNNAPLTREKFIQLPTLGNKVVYKTGDLARWTAGETIELFGRLDHQIKIRGFRIELGEIETAIQQNASFREVIVIEREDSLAQKHLAAYYVNENGVDTEKLRESLAEILPEYMIPRYFVRIDEIPITLNGKLDKMRLPDPEGILDTKQVCEELFTETESKLSGIWKRVLSVSQIGNEDHFFQLGGQSLNAMILLAEIYKDFEVKLSLNDVFNHPIMKEMAECIDQCTKTTVLHIKPVERKAFYPLSSAQQRMYILHHMNKNSIGYNIPGAIMIEGSVERGRLENAIHKIIDLHSAFRTTFELLNGKPVQIVHDKVAFTLLETSAMESEMETLFKEFVRPFELSSAPLLRMKLVILGNSKQVLFLDMHHIISDGMSLAIFIEDLLSLYQGSEVKRYAIEYKDYAEWSHEQKETPEHAEKEQYWLSQFSDEVPTLYFPTDFMRPVKKSYEGSKIDFEIDEKLKNDINEFCMSNRVTLHMFLFAAYSSVLRHYTGKEDIVIGMPVSGRCHPELFDIIGMFINTLPVRSAPEKSKLFLDYLVEVKDHILSALNNQEYQLEDLVEKLNIERDPGREPLFDTVFVTQNFHVPHLSCGNLRVTVIELDSFSSKYDLGVAVFEEGERIKISVNYCSRLFKSETIERLIKDYLRVIGTIIKEPCTRVADVLHLSYEETKVLVQEFCKAKSEYPSNLLLLDMFEKRVKETPYAVALVHERQTMTYHELNAKANQLARSLRAEGVWRDRLVGLLAERSFDLIVGIYAIIKAGGAYLPLSSQLPAKRIDLILVNSGCAVLLKHRKLGSDLEYSGTIIDLDNQDLYSGEESDLGRINNPNDLAYVIYTSGSTGQPKGVMIEHRSAINTLLTLQEAYPLNESDSYMLKTTCTFDVSVAELFGWFFGGGRLVLLRDGSEKNPYEIIRTIIAENVTHINFIPSMFNFFLKTLSASDMKLIEKLRYIFLAGEVLMPETVRLFRQLTCKIELVNLYGPTEATIYVTNYSLLDWCDNSHVPIGKPINNTRVYIMNDNHIVGIGIPGEICIAGNGLARGYLHDEELTQDKFVDDPLFPTERMYKSGDMAKWLPDGNIEFLGRIDTQIKIHGFRVECGEIESRIMEIESVKSVVVIGKKDQGGDVYLCAYIVSDRRIHDREIKDFLKERFPQYMIPLRYAYLNAIPLTVTGKQDRKALLSFDVTNRDSDDLVEPQNETESIVIAIWRQVLHSDAFGVTDSFFEVGGNSLKAIQAYMLLSNDYEISFDQMFSHSTARELAKVIKRNERSVSVRIEDAVNRLGAIGKVTDEIKYEEGFYEAFSQYKKSYQHLAEVDLSKKEEGVRSVLLTGATGYLGSYILNGILRDTKCSVFALVRGEDKGDSERRLSERYKSYFGKNALKEYSERVQVVSGDLELEYFGLPHNIYESLAENADCIINAAANVKHYGDKREFIEINVKGVERLIGFAKEGKQKVIHHISTLSVGAGFQGDSVLFTENCICDGNMLDSVYLSTKCMAEELLFREKSEGLCVSIYRVGNVVFDSNSGSFQQNISENGFYLMLKSLIQLECIPEIRTKTLDFSFVDFVSKAIVLLFDKEKIQNEVFHITNPNRISLVEFSDYLHEAEIELRVMEAQPFIKMLDEQISDTRTGVDYANLLLHSNILNSQPGRNIILSSDKTDFILNALGFSWRRIEKEDVKKMIEYCRAVNFLR